MGSMVSTVGALTRRDANLPRSLTSCVEHKNEGAAKRVSRAARRVD